MNNTIKIGIAFLMLLLAGTIAYDSTLPKPVNWNKTYSLRDKIPFGLYVFDHELTKTLPKSKVEKITVTPYEYYQLPSNYDTLTNEYKAKGTIMAISEYTNIDSESIKEICYYVSNGNSAFLSLKVMPQELLDTLRIKTKSAYKYTDTIYNWVANQKLGTQKYNLTEGMGNNYFTKYDTLSSSVLGFHSGDTSRVNFVKVNYRSGTFYLHLQPAAFTNIHLLKDNHHQYAEKVLSYVPPGKIFWFVKDQTGDIISKSPMRFILSQPALKWAWYLFLLGMLIFMVFNAKRKQRVVPIIMPLSNTTIDFTKSIGNLYYQEGDHDNIINKKIIYFLEKIRNEYLIDTGRLDDEFIKKLQHKSGKDLNDIKKAIFLINAHRKSPHSSIEEDLIQINNAIEKII